MTRTRNTSQIKGKKVGIIVPGGSPVDAKQYALIKSQFECMAQYLSWDIIFYKPIYASERDEIKNNSEMISEIEKLGESINR